MGNRTVAGDAPGPHEPASTQPPDDAERTPDGEPPPAADGDGDPAAIDDATHDTVPGRADDAGRRRLDDGPGRSPARTALLVAGLVAIAGGIPLAVALGVLHDPRWYPSLDMAQTELRVSDVGTGDPPLVGLAGRFFAFGERGSHPGPLSFWALWPFYKLLGSTAWALQAATVFLNLVAMGLAVWIGHRRGGVRLALVVAVGVALLAQAYTADRLTVPWNPYLPVMWWVVFLLAVWSVLCDDLPMLPVAVFAGSFCAQTHIPYLGPVAGLSLVTAGVVVRRLARRRRWPVRDDGAGGRPAPSRRTAALIGSGSLVLLLVLWLPPLIEQWTNDLGNAGLVRESFTHPLDDRVAFRTALDTWLAHLNVWGLSRIEGPLTISRAPMGSPVPGLLLLTVWFAAAAVTWRRRQDQPGLWRLHVVVGLAALLGLLAMSRILGEVWDYLVLWAWGTTLLMVLATLVTAGSLLSSRSSRWASWWPRRRQTWVLAGALVVVSTAFTVGATSTEPLSVPESQVLANVAPRVLAAVQEGERPDGTPVPGGGREGRYLVRWHDNELATPGVGFGLLLELERQGVDVGGPTTEAATVVPHRVRRLEDATATINHVVGESQIERWRAIPGAVEVAYADLRTPSQRQRYRELYDEVVADLQAAGLDDLAQGASVNLLATLFNERTPLAVQRKGSRLLELGAPAAVFIAPPEAG